MELDKVLDARRSVRAYENKPVDKALLDEMIKAAQKAPTWKNSQTGRYYVISSEAKLEAVKACLPEFNRKNCADAPVIIVTAYEMKRSGFDREGNADNELGDKWGAYDLGLQNGNLLLKAKDLGLDTLVMGLRDASALREVLGIPESQEVVSVISVGYSTATPEMPKRKELEAVATFF